MSLLTAWIIRALIVFVTAYLVPGFRLESFVSALALVAILGVFNLFVKPLLLFFTLPINLLTLGLFTLIHLNLLFSSLINHGMTKFYPGYCGNRGGSCFIWT